MFTQKEIASFKIQVTRHNLISSKCLQLCLNYDAKALHSIIFHQQSLLINEFVLGHDLHCQIKQWSEEFNICVSVNEVVAFLSTYI
jgi:hypothetical protein